MVDQNSLRALLHENAAWNRYATYKEVPIIAELLHLQDVIRDVGFGIYEDHNGLVVVTDNRVLFGGRRVASLLNHTKTEIFEFSKITSVQVNGSALLSTLTIVTSGTKGEIKSMASSECRRVAEVIRIQMQKMSTTSKPARPISFDLPKKVSNNVMDELERLAKMHSNGLLTQEEFAAAKAKILGL